MTPFTPMILAAESSWERVDISILNSSIVALLGYAMIFFGLILLMAVIIVIGTIFTASAKKNKTVEVAAAAAQAEPAPAQSVAPGTAGQLKLYNVEPKTAAMIMAIVANKMGKPLNELRFISIKEVE